MTGAFSDLTVDYERMDMKIIVVGASGLIGSKIVELLLSRHEVIKVGRTRGNVTVDYTERSSIQDMYRTIGSFDALVSAAGGQDTYFGPLGSVGEDEFRIGIGAKLMGQINLVLIGRDFINEEGSFTLSSGYLSHYPNPNSCATGPINAAIDCFALSASLGLPRGIRINSVSPAPVVTDGDVSKGTGRVTLEETAAAYVRCIEEDFTGKTVRVWNM